MRTRYWSPGRRIGLDTDAGPAAKPLGDGPPAAPPGPAVATVTVNLTSSCPATELNLLGKPEAPWCRTRRPRRNFNLKEGSESRRTMITES
jgi:hypothetical protein